MTSVATTFQQEELMQEQEKQQEQQQQPRLRNPTAYHFAQQQQRQRYTLRNPTIYHQSADYTDDPNQRSLEIETQRQLQQYETSYSSLQLPTGLPTYPISHPASEQQTQQQNDTSLAGQNLLTQYQQRGGSSQYQNSRQHDGQTSNELFMPMQSEHGLQKQNPLPNTFGVSPGHYPSQLQGNIHHQVSPLQSDCAPMDIDEASLQSQSSFNVLIKSGIAKISDFGLSGRIMSSSIGDGAAAYRDPLSFRVPLYKRGKKSDVFSLGVLLWEISSGQIPLKVLIKDHYVKAYTNN
ncbi:4041_t:CDS:2 [Paraglomus occultum]|uniref:4041_t:CDS:1 n=1 Tax=Paraglomus occultum TaxID=144539 RepID=A0A9N8WHY0_9GLOM|nr:4041_t:CDS:2 [Paraglomus occultum]